MVWEDFYKILQVHYQAEQEVIEASYKRLSKKYHPDIKPGRYAEERMKKLNYAYETLGDKNKRLAYHEQWTRMQVNRNSSINSNTYSDTYSNTNSNISYNKQQNQDRNNFDEAIVVLKEYFEDLVEARYFKAYSKLTANDRRNITQDEFVKWQEAVSNVFLLGSYNINFFKENEYYTLGKVRYEKVREYGVDTTDKYIKTGRVSKESITKYVVFENKAWFVNLGYEDLKTLTYKFQSLQRTRVSLNHEEVFNQILLKMDALTGLLSREGFIEKARIEADRSTRYGSKFSIAVLKLIFKEKMEIVSEEEGFNLAILQASDIINTSMRTSDIIGRWGKNEFIILLSETDDNAACLAINKLYYCLKESLKTCVYAGVIQYMGGDLIRKIKEAEYLSSFSKIHCSLSKIRSDKESDLKIVSRISYKRLYSHPHKPTHE